MNFNKFGLGKGGVFGVCEGLSNFTGLPVLAFRILALYLMYNGLFIFYWYAWIVLFLGNFKKNETRKVVNYKFTTTTTNGTTTTSGTTTKSSFRERLDKSLEELQKKKDLNSTKKSAWDIEWDTDFKTKKKKGKKKGKKKKNKVKKKEMGFNSFKKNHYDN